MCDQVFGSDSMTVKWQHFLIFKKKISATLVFVPSKLDVGDSDNSDRNTLRWTQNVQKFGIQKVVPKFTINVAQICFFNTNDLK